MAALKAHGIGTLVDIRSFPMSRRLPHFNRESLEVEIAEARHRLRLDERAGRPPQEDPQRFAQHRPAQRLIPQLR